MTNQRPPLDRIAGLWHGLGEPPAGDVPLAALASRFTAIDRSGLRPAEVCAFPTTLDALADAAPTRESSTR